jgi:hypothetical protein
MIAAVANGGSKSMVRSLHPPWVAVRANLTGWAVQVRVNSAADRDGIQQALDVGADGGDGRAARSRSCRTVSSELSHRCAVLIPYINTAEEARAAVSCALYPTAGTRSVYFPQRSMNKKGLLGCKPVAGR